MLSPTGQMEAQLVASDHAITTRKEINLRVHFLFPPQTKREPVTKDLTKVPVQEDGKLKAEDVLGPAISKIDWGATDVDYEKRERQDQY